MTSTGGDAKELFLDALDLGGATRERFLDDLRRRAPELAARVTALLSAHEGRAANALESLGGSLRGLLHGKVGEAGAVVGDYELLEEVASGASGVVWRARQRSLDRVVALKVLRAGRLAGAREVERFRAEAEAVARFHHPDVVPVYEVGEHEGRHFFSMRYYPGGSLADRVGPGDRWEPRAAARMVRTIARAVHHAHQRGLLHRDLKPSNVLLDEQGAPAVADFGVAARIDDAGVAAVTTAALAGTPAYMAPEQTGPGGIGVRGGSELTVATDVWALGCILYELLGGRPPFVADTLSGILAKVRDEPPFPLRALAPDAPRDLETIVLRCLAKEPSRRYASANALAIDLGRWLEHEPILARRTGPLERLVLAWRRSPVAASLAVLVGLLVVALAAGASWASVQLQARLRDSYLGEARATRLSGAPGRRARALELLAKAAAIRPGPDLRDEAIACLALPDLAPVATVPFAIGAVGPASVDAELTRVAYGTSGGEVVVLRLPDGAELFRARAGGRCDDALLSPDGRTVAATLYAPGAGPQDAEMRAWSVDGGRELLRVPCRPARGAAAFDAAGERLALGAGNGDVTVWDLAAGAPAVRLALGTFVGAVAFRGDGAALAIALGDSEGDDDARLEVRALPAGELLHRAPLPSYAFATAWTPADDAVVVACADYAAYVVGVPRAESGAALASDGARDPVPSGDADADVRRRPTAPEIVLRGHRAEVVGLALSPAGGVAATSSWDQTMRLWELADGQELVRLPAQALGFSRDGRRVAYRTIDAFQVAEVVHGRVLHTLHGHAGKAPGAVAFSRDGALLASYGDDGAMLWDTATWGPLGRLAPTDADGVEFAPDGDTFYLSWDGGLERRRVSAPFEPGELLLAGDQDHCDLSADGTLLAVRAGDALQLLDASGPGAPRLTRTIPGFPGFEYVSVGARGTYVAGETWKGPGLSVWRASDGALLGRLREDRSALGAAIAPDETRLVVGDGIGYEVYALPGLERVHVIERDVAMRESPGTIAFSADGAVLALGLTDDVVGLFDGRTYAPLARLESRGAALDGRAELSPDGSLLAVSSLSNRVCVWDLPELRRELAAAGIAWE